MSSSTQNVIAFSSLLLSSSLFLAFVTQAQHELLSECVCWTIILLGGKLYSHFGTQHARPQNSVASSSVAFGIALTCLSSSLQKRVWFTAPILSLLIVIIQRGSGLLPQHEILKEKDAPTTSSRPTPPVRITYLCTYTIVALVALAQQSSWRHAHLEICWLFAQGAFYWGIFDGVNQINNTRSDGLIEALLSLTELSYFMIPITISFVVLRWEEFSFVPAVGLIALAKACRFLAVFVLAYQSKITIPAWSTIFTVCTYSLSTSPQTWQSVLTIFSAFGALWQIAVTFPQSPTGKLLIIGFALCPLWAFGIYGSSPSTSINLSCSLGYTEIDHTTTSHPIQRVTEEARARFAKIQRAQSKTLLEAVGEYKKRYGRKPPPGFDRWYQFAVENDVQLIDEYDYMTKSFEPFWNMSPKILRDYAEQAVAFDSSSFNTLTISNHTAKLADESFQHAQLVELLEPVVHLIPDLTAALNEYDEPRVLIPHDKISQKMLRPTDKAQQIYIGQQDRQKIWESVTIPCSPDSPARSLSHEQKQEVGLRFITNLSASQDICEWPSSASTRHGFLSSPSTFHFTHSYVPILATAKFSTFSDIMIPSSYYFQDDIAEMDDSKDSAFEDKRDMVYWRGSSTGGHWTDGSWVMGHRQRFVNLTNTDEGEIVILNKTSSGHWAPIKTEFRELRNKFKVEFSNFIQCEDDDCKAQEDHFHKAEWDANNDAISSKIVYNLDGNSFSGRYYRLLKSNSLVFMQALFKEWHDDRLIPWVHFVPISNSMEELPETTRYLLDDPMGKVIAKRIASEGRDWSRKALRKVDMTAAYLRVFLEYARLVDDNRASMA